MSRIGKYPIQIPEGVSVEVNGALLKAKGKLGELSVETTELVSLNVVDSAVMVSPVNESKNSRSLWGTYRSLIQGLVTGVSEGFTKVLELNGVGYRAQVQGNELVMQLGLSHEVRFPIPGGITITCEKPILISVHGADKQLVGQVAANIRSFRKPEPYKGKGIKYSDEVIFRKEGKKK